MVGESVESVQPEEPEETQPSIPENAPAFYQTMQEVQGKQVFELSTAQDLFDLSDWVAQGNETENMVFVLQNDIDLENELSPPSEQSIIPSGEPSWGRDILSAV